MTDRTLFDLPHSYTQPRARRGDPETSHEAAERMKASGKAAGHREACLLAVIGSPGLTAAEIAARVGLEHVAAQRRLSDLAKDGVIRKGDPRTCRVKGSRMTTWFPREGREG